MSDTNDTINDEQPSDYDRPPRSKARLAFTTALFLVIILLLIAIFSPVRDVVINHFLTTAPTATPTLIPGGNQFYIQACPQGTVTIDGYTVTKFPNPYNGDPPLMLSRGQHKIVWQAPPFQTLSCIVSVPPVVGEPCNYETIGDYFTGDSSARYISFDASISNLPDVQQAALKQAIQNTLDSLQSSTTLQPGEQYVYAPSSSATTVRTATQPLRASLSLHLDANPNSHNSCTPNGDFCTLSGQNCLQICSNGGTTSSNGTFTWDIIALYYHTWTYTTLSGQVVAQNQPDTSSPLVGVDHSIDLQVTWNGKAWKVNVPHYNTLIPSTGDPQFSLPQTFAPMMPPPACASLNSFINTPTSIATFATPLGTTEGSNPKAVSWGFVVGTNEADGCLGVVVAAPNTTATPTDFKQPPAYFLYRFGVLFAANPLAHSEFPSVPLADAYEQSIAQSIEAKLKY